MQLTPKQQNQWDQKNTPDLPLQQTTLWGKFQESLGRKVYFLTLGKNSKVTAQGLVVKHPLPLGNSYLYIPRGPILDQSHQNYQTFQKFLRLLEPIAKKEGAIFVRFDPAINKESQFGKDLIANYKNASGAIHQPENTLILDLTPNEETLLQEMKSKTRYNIRLAKRKGVVIKQATSEKDINEFLKINQETAKRDKFQVHENQYYHDLLKFFKDTDPKIKLFLAQYQGKTIAAIIVAFFNQTAIYLHGASANEYRNLMAPHLLQWTAIKIAKKLGFKQYDFWGIAPNDQPNHPWSGITRFKKGFGGKEINYVPVREFVYQPFWYHLMKIGSKFKH